MKTTRHKLTRCPHCDHKLDASSSANVADATPRPGDFSMCWGCASILRYRHNLSLGVCAPWELEELEQPDRLLLLSMAARRRDDIRKEALH